MLTRLLAAASLTLMLLATPIAPSSASATEPGACGSSLTAADATTIATLSAPRPTPTDPAQLLPAFESRVAEHQQIVDLLSAAHDRRGLFFIGLAVAEREAVLPRQRVGVRPDPAWARRLSLDLLNRAMAAIHAEFTGAAQPYHWARYFQAAQDCTSRAANVAMVGYNAHLTVDLAESVATARTRLWHVPGYNDLVASIAAQGQVMAATTVAAYGRDADFGPMWRFYCFGEYADQVSGLPLSQALLQFADLGYSALALQHGQVIENPVLAPWERHVVWQQWATLSQVLRTFPLP